MEDLMAESELDRIDPEPYIVSLKSGFRVQVARMRTRQFFRFLKVLTRGAGEALMRTQLDFDSAQFGQRLLTITLFSIPEAEDQALQFIWSMVMPAELVEEPRGVTWSKKLREENIEKNKALWDQLNDQLNNPDLDDLVTIVEAVIKQEGPEIQSLGKRLADMISSLTPATEEKATEETEEKEPEAASA